MSDDGTPALSDLVDQGTLGPEPSDDYLAALDMLDNVVRECMFVSKRYAGIPSPHTRHFYASVLFTLMLTRSVSLLMLAPHTPWAVKRIEHWDYGSMTGVARTLIELRIAFFYLCSEQCPEDEWQFRWNLFNLHDCTSRIRMFDAFGDEDQVEGFKTQADELRERLTTNPFFETIDPKRRKKLLHGQTAYLAPLETIAERAGIDLWMFRFLYVLFSSHVHALPMSFYRIGGDYPERGRGLPSEPEEGYSSLCLSLSATLLVRTRDEIHALFEPLEVPDACPFPSPAEPETPPAMEIGEAQLVDATDEIQLRIRRTDERLYTTTYIHRPAGAEVLERSDDEDGTTQLLFFDPYFWTVFLDGGPATEGALEQAIENRHAHRIDHLNREIHFKTE